MIETCPCPKCFNQRFGKVLMGRPYFALRKSDGHELELNIFDVLAFQREHARA